MKSFFAMLLVGMPVSHAGQPIPIDLTGTGVAVTATDKIKLSGVSALGQRYDVDLQWNPNDLRFDISAATLSTQANPSGIYCSCPPTTRAGSHSVIAQVAQKDFVRGILIRVEWREIEQSQGRYQWDILDNELSLARQYGKKVALAVVNGLAAPSWLGTAGAQMFNYNFGSTATSMPVPWDAVYLSAWTNFVAQLGARYKDNPDIALVHITHSSANGFEMQLPFSPSDQSAWLSTKYAYTPSKLISSWKTVIDAFGTAFPTHKLDVEVHPINVDVSLDADQVAREVSSYGATALGSRFGTFAAWWSQRNAQTVYPGMFDLLKQASSKRFAGVQMVASYVSDPSKFGAGGIAADIDFATSNGVRYLEIWNSDLIDSSLEQTFRSTASRL